MSNVKMLILLPATCRDMSSVMSPPQENAVSARVFHVGNSAIVFLAQTQKMYGTMIPIRLD